MSRSKCGLAVPVYLYYLSCDSNLISISSLWYYPKCYCKVSHLSFHVTWQRYFIKVIYEASLMSNMEQPLVYYREKDIG